MTWKAIGDSVIGTAHTTSGRGCEDAICYRVHSREADEALICCVSDGAGSASFASPAATYTVNTVVEALTALSGSGDTVTEGKIYAIVEGIYDGFTELATRHETDLNEFSCTLLGCYIFGDKAAFFRIGDGALVRDDGDGGYVPVWWPFNGEYHNTTSFLVDDKTMAHLDVMILDERVNEVAIFTDGLQMLALNMENHAAHKPFFTGLFHHLRAADSDDKLSMLGKKLTEYLAGDRINERTDDDKTLFLATRLAP